VRTTDSKPKFASKDSDEAHSESQSWSMKGLTKEFLSGKEQLTIGATLNFYRGARNGTSYSRNCGLFCFPEFPAAFSPEAVR
jgi:hypothetical protein